VAERDELRGLFGGLNARNPRSCKDVAFRDLVFRDQIECFAPKPDFSCRDRSPRAERFGGNIDHLCATVGGDMGETPHRSAADRNHFAAGLIIVTKIVLLRFAIDNVEEKLFEFLITRAGSQRFHDIELEVAAKTRT
jgi:hypothetical protein